MPRRRTWILLAAAVLVRLLLQGWDSGLLSPHPDERQVAFVAERMAGWFTDPGFYAYGSLHFNLTRLMAMIGQLPLAYGGFLVAGRTLSLAASMVALLLAWSMARRTWGERTGEVFLVVGALVPLDLQLSHFATVEAHHALWVMATLVAAHGAVRRPTPLWALAVGGAWGLSVAVKVASLPLAAPLVVAAAASVVRHGWRLTGRQAALAAVAAGTAFWLGQPSALVGMRPPWWPLALAGLAAGLLALPAVRGRRLVDAAAVAALVLAGLLPVAAQMGWLAVPAGRLAEPYLHGVGEQLAMVSGAADVPYVRVYRPTAPLLYSAGQLAAWGLGPGLALAALGAAVLAVRCLLRRRRRWYDDRHLLLALLLAWVVPVGLRLATLEVKFLRYWTPLVLPLALLAAWSLVRVRRTWRGPLVAVVGAAAVLAGVTYLWAFATPHPHRQAATWVDPVLGQGEVIAVEHWDEGLPLAALGRGGRTVTLPSYDLPEDEAKVRRWAEALGEARWVVLTSHRVRRTVAANPHRFPRTGRLYEELLSGRAGFEVAAVAERGPRLLGLDLPVQRADESFVNYDFPRVVLLRRTAPTDVDALVAVSADGLPPTFARLESLLAPAPRLPFEPLAREQAAAVLAWLAVMLLIAGASWVLLEPLLRSWADAGLGVAAVTGWTAVAWALWVGSELGLWSVGAEACSVAVVVMTAAAVARAVGGRRALAETLRRRRRGIVSSALAAMAIFTLFAGVRLFNPAVYWGEKPMDFSFLNAFLRADRWPPGEPWMAGEPLNYYYFGEILAAVPILAADLPGRLGYNLMAATIPALAGAALTGLGLTLAGRRRRWGLALPFLVLLSGNLAWPFLLNLARAGRWFDLWWATSRVIPGFAIDEYPLWTTLFADLHGHFIALPVAVAAAAWAWQLGRRRRRWLGPAVLCALCVAVLAATNPWDLLLFTAAAGTVAAAVARRRWTTLLRLAAAAALSLVLAVPFLLELAAWMRSGVGGRTVFFNGADFAPAWAIARHLGLFLLPLLVVAVSRVGREVVVALVLAVAGVAAGFAFGSEAAAVGLATAGVFAATLGRERDGRARLAWTLAMLAMLAVALCERVTFVDRMNTLFKIYNGIWVLLAAALTLTLVTSEGWRRRLLLAVWLPLQLVALVNLPLGVAQGIVQPRISSPRPSLDGQAFLRRHDPQTRFLMTTLNGLAADDDVVLEAAGDPYREFTRIAMHTGLATVVGWEHHLFQRGHARADIHGRFADVMAFYNGQDPALRRRLLDHYGVDWVVVADVERGAYDLRGEAWLDRVPGLVRVAHHRGASLYRVERAEAVTVRVEER